MKNQIYIERLIRYSEKIVRYMLNVDVFDTFSKNDEKVDAIMLNLEQIGETAKKLSLECKNQYADIHWPSIIGLRNMISHEYEGIKLNIIYDIASISIPAFLHELKKKR